MPGDNNYQVNNTPNNIGGYPNMETPATEETQTLDPYQTNEVQTEQTQQPEFNQTPVYPMNQRPTNETPNPMIGSQDIDDISVYQGSPAEDETTPPEEYIPTIEENTTPLPTVEGPETEESSEIQELKSRMDTLEDDMRNFISATQTLMKIADNYSDEETTTETPELQTEATDETYNQLQHQELPQDPSDPANVEDFVQKVQSATPDFNQQPASQESQINI